ncbi:MAG: ABC transporter permease [Lachnospiraceae bacterium]
MEKKSLMKRLTSSREMSLVLVLILLCAFIQFRNPSFLTPATIGELFKNYTVTFIIAVGMMLILLIGGIDIAVGSTLGFSGMTASLILRDNPGLPTILIMLISIVVGLICGLIIGLIITYGKVPAIICTMGAMNIYRGMAYLVAKSQWVAAYQFSDNYKAFAQSKNLSFGLLNNLVTVMILIYVIFFIVMKWTSAGRKVYAVGSNVEAATVSGIRVNKVKVTCYAVLGTLCGLGGALYTSLYASAQGNMGEGMEMDVIAACVVGGVSMTGGRGSVVGVFLGALILSIIGKGLPLIGVSQFWQTAIKGLIILVAVIVNVMTQRQMEKAALKGREI